jgi:hypothetical protein
MQPVTIKCMECRHFTDVMKVKQRTGFLFLCPAYPRGIPEKIRSWETPHTEILQGQEDDIVFEEIQDKPE